MRKVFRLLIHDEQRRLKQLWRQHDADVERWFPTRLLPSAHEDTSVRADVCTDTEPGHHDTDGPARLTPVKALRCASTPQGGAHGLDRASSEPGPGLYVMAQEPASHTDHSTADRKEVTHAG